MLEQLLRFVSTGEEAAFEGLSADLPVADAAPVVRLAAEAYARLEGETCAVCLGEFQQPAQTRCTHIFCYDCIQAVIARSSPRCPLCRQEPRPVARVLPPAEEQAQHATQYDVAREGGAEGPEPAADLPPPRFSKIEYLLDHVATIRDDDPEAKVLVFSQFDSTVAALADALGGCAETIRGSMAPTRRARSLRRFEEEAAVGCLLLTTRTAGAGINITCANHIVIYDVQWSKGLEDQVVGRAWRMGQRRRVTVWRYVSEDTIESRLAATRGNGALSAATMRGLLA